MKEWSHVFEPRFDEPTDLPGSWKRGEGPVILELACGKGFYTVALAERVPASTLVGVDIKGSRLWHGGRRALDLGLANALFLRTRIEELTRYFAPGEVDEIWITFPDPHPREGKERKRLTSARFLEIYRKVLKPGGLVHLKTDSTPLYEWTKEVIQAEGCSMVRDESDVYAIEDEILHIKTDYEQRFLKQGKLIRYVSFQLN